MPGYVKGKLHSLEVVSLSSWNGASSATNRDTLVTKGEPVWQMSPASSYSTEVHFLDGTSWLMFMVKVVYQFNGVHAEHINGAWNMPKRPEKKRKFSFAFMMYIYYNIWCSEIWLQDFSLGSYTMLLVRIFQALLDYHTQALCRLIPSNAESNSSATPTTPWDAVMHA